MLLTEDGRRHSVNESYLPYQSTKGVDAHSYSNSGYSKRLSSYPTLKIAANRPPPSSGILRDEWNLEELHFGIVMFK